MPTVLIADDEHDHRELLAMTLRRLGHAVVTAADADVSFELVVGGGIDAALIDMRMPGGSGLDLCRRIRARTEFEGLPIMMISADAYRSQIMAALHAGADDYLPKPFRRAELTARLETLLRPSGSPAARAAAASRMALTAACRTPVPTVPHHTCRRIA